MPFHKYLAELLGAFTLTFAVLLTTALQAPLSTPVAAALTLGLFVYTIGPLSGAHLNPAVTLGMMSIRKISGHDAAFYVFCQAIGASLALFVSRAILAEPVRIVAENSLGAGLAEALGAFFLAFAVAAATAKKVPAEASGLAVGGSLLLGITLASSYSAGVLNPAVALGLSALNLAYGIGPIVGAVAGAWAFTFLYER
ncbi:MAG: aquaporin [Candidatus Peregrinibacteria bacterium]|nr:aquaporin [Candidatus Peregrinibacteria bacterium]